MVFYDGSVTIPVRDDVDLLNIALMAKNGLIEILVQHAQRESA